jgi:hypothetical protein
MSYIQIPLDIVVSNTITTSRDLEVPYERIPSSITYSACNISRNLEFDFPTIVVLISTRVAGDIKFICEPGIVWIDQNSTVYGSVNNARSVLHHANITISFEGNICIASEL